MLRVASAKEPIDVKRGRSRGQPRVQLLVQGRPAFLRRESRRTLEMRGCLQDRQSSQEDTSWWDSTSTRLR